MTEQRDIAVVSVGRSDFGRYLPILRAMDDTPGLQYSLLAGGAHFDPRFGPSIQEIEASGVDWVPGLGAEVSEDSPAAVGKSIAKGTHLLAEHFEHHRPDLVVLSGDRFEMLSAAAAAIGFNLPIVHLHGGAVTEGAIDEQVRHALTKMSHFHLVVCDLYSARVRQMGEEPWRVAVTGAPGLDGIEDTADLSMAEISAAIGHNLNDGYFLVCFHPVTVEADQIDFHIEQLMHALNQLPNDLVITYPNADFGHSRIIQALQQFRDRNPTRTVLLENAGNRLFLSLLRHAAGILGNSSSGIVEAATFKTPAINIGTRQDGKMKPAQVIDCDHHANAILQAVDKARSETFCAQISSLVNPYGDGCAGPRIAEILSSLPLDDRLLRKRFVGVDEAA
ncbi:MAG: UDP-N-acetylglucosamine 2-epimerase (hydrolyzing) [Rhodospirillaceae bacterium]|nr:UDP-N-acetylglucosamine 2-epimerase (hydrolyzing) [Rhodospirillaceae bacterium]MBT6086196.1 UDP-N-acetylglucosamine 2-epimerase (hydrolyzing) [Rhodospirillaceae bacterium]MBT6607438.1 UDP-N-acetylglucosamine 2-epimerase (hydrolyzing) [Rhodospirillaceae bacterium]